MELRQGGIYLYEPPTNSIGPQGALVNTSGSEQSGYRPYVVVSRDLINRNKRTVIGVPLSTKTDKANAFRILLPVAELISEPGSQYVLKESVALCDHVRVLDADQIRKKAGMVSQNALAAITLGLAYVLDIR